MLGQTGGHQRFRKVCVTQGGDRVQEAQSQTQGGCITATTWLRVPAVARTGSLPVCATLQLVGLVAMT